MLDTGNNKWSYPEISGEAPTPRADTVIEYDAKGSKLVVFGGWANEWFADICTLDVAHVVGPPFTGSPPIPRSALKAILILPGAHAMYGSNVGAGVADAADNRGADGWKQRKVEERVRNGRQWDRK